MSEEYIEAPNDLPSFEEFLEETKKEQEVEPEKKSKGKSSKVNAVRISGIINRKHVLFRAEIDGEKYVRCVPVENWTTDEQEFTKTEFVGFEKPAFAKN